MWNRSRTRRFAFATDFADIWRRGWSVTRTQRKSSGRSCSRWIFLYGEWSDLARDAHAAYLRRELTTKEFLRRIDVFHELDSYDESAPKEPGKSVFQERVERNIDFDPAAAYQTIQVFDGRDSDAVPEWKTYSAEDSKRQEQQGHESLREKYGKG